MVAILEVITERMLKTVCRSDLLTGVDGRQVDHKNIKINVSFVVDATLVYIICLADSIWEVGTHVTSDC